MSKGLHHQTLKNLIRWVLCGEEAAQRTRKFRPIIFTNPLSSHHSIQHGKVVRKKEKDAFQPSFSCKNEVGASLFDRFSTIFSQKRTAFGHRKHCFRSSKVPLSMFLPIVKKSEVVNNQQIAQNAHFFDFSPFSRRLADFSIFEGLKFGIYLTKRNIIRKTESQPA